MEEAKEEERLEEGKHKGEEEEKEASSEEKNGDTEHKKKEKKKKKGKKKDKKKKKNKKKEAFDILATLSEEQKDLLIQFKKRLGLLPRDEDDDEEETEKEEEKEELTTKQREWCDNMCLCRYLRARDWDLDQSELMIRNTLKWREEYKPEEITAEEIESEALPGKMYFNLEFDKHKRPVVYMKPARDNSTDRVIKLKYLVWILEIAIKHMDASAGVEKMTWIVDFSNTGLRQSSYSNIQISLDCLHVLLDHYPERLGVAFMLNTPWMFGAFWKFISPWLNEVTVSKIRFLAKGEYSQMLDTVDADELEQNYSGDKESDYDHDLFKERFFAK